MKPPSAKAASAIAIAEQRAKKDEAEAELITVLSTLLNEHLGAVPPT